MGKPIDPLRINNFGLAQHQFQVHNATVPAGTTAEDLEDPQFWSHVKHKMRIHDEIRAVAEDSSFVARVLVTYCDSFEVLTKVLWGAKLDVPSPTELQEHQARYYVKQRGRLRWCLVDRETDRNIREGISKRSDAERELEDFLRAQAA